MIEQMRIVNDRKEKGIADGIDFWTARQGYIGHSYP
jgi:hypothetical protein